MSEFGLKKFQVKKGGGLIHSHFSPIFGFWKFLQVFDIFKGAKNTFFQIVLQQWSSFRKKIHCIFRYNRGGGSDPNVTLDVFLQKCGAFVLIRQEKAGIFQSSSYYCLELTSVASFLGDTLYTSSWTLKNFTLDTNLYIKLFTAMDRT